MGKDDSIVFSQDLGVLVHTDPDKIAEWLKARLDTTTLVITTYQSRTAIAEASRKADFSFDLGMMDEAHKTVGILGLSTIPIRYFPHYGFG